MQNTSFSQHKHKNETQIAYYVANLCSCTKGNGYIYFSFKIVMQVSCSLRQGYVALRFFQFA